MDKSELLEKLRKIYALAERGESGEKENAAAILARLMKEHGISEQKIADDVADMVWFRYGAGFESRLLSQIIYSVMGEVTEYERRNGRGRTRETGVKCTLSQRLEIEVAFSVYSQAFKNELELFYKAFLAKNEIFPPPELTATDVSEKKLSPEEMERLLLMASGIKKSELHKLIGDAEQ